MTEREFSAMGTSWWISADVPALEEAEAEVWSVERTLSRFLPESALSRLNARRAAIDPVLAEVTRVALNLSEITRGAFDPTLGARLAELGYDRPFDEIGRPARARPFDGARPRVSVRGDRVRLEGSGALDLGGVAKGWTVDRVLSLLAARAEAVMSARSAGPGRSASERSSCWR
jgi:FAD:protein FMN transferase